VDSDAYNSSGASCSPSLGLAAAWRYGQRGWFSIRVESVRGEQDQAVRIRERRPVPPREARERTDS